MIKNIQLYFFIALFLVVLGFNLAVLRPFIGALVVALSLAVIFNRFYQWLNKSFLGNKSFSAIMTVLVVLLIIIIPAAFLGGVILKEATLLYTVFKEGGGEVSINQVSNFINTGLQKYIPSLSVDVRIYFEKIIDWLVKNIGSIFSSISSVVFSLFLALMALYYLLKDGGKFKKIIIDLSPLADSQDQDIFNKLAKTVSSVLKGSLLVALAQGVLTGIGFLIFGIPNSAVWGAVAVLAALIPLVGTALVVIPGIIYLIASGAVGAAIGFLIWGALVVGGIDNILRPKLLERGINIHPFFILLSVLGGLKLFGPVGFLLGPLLLSLLFALLEIYKREFKKEVE